MAKKAEVGVLESIFDRKEGRKWIFMNKFDLGNNLQNALEDLYKDGWRIKTNIEFGDASHIVLERG